MRNGLVVICIIVALASHVTPVAAQDAVGATWTGHIDGVPTWITVVPHGHTLDESIVQSEPWWKWGNTDTDSYIFAINDPNDVRLVLTFSKDAETGHRAELYLNDQGASRIAYRIDGEDIEILSNDGFPFATILSRNGGWLREDEANYDLTLLVDGPCRGFGYSEAETDGTIDTRIVVGSYQPGVPDWQTTELLHDPKPGWGYPRFGSFKRMRDAPPFRVKPGLMPTFPYLGMGAENSNWFEQNANPLWFDIRRSSFVLHPFPGFQNGGMFNINSFSAPPDVNFEAPFAFYNFDSSTRQAHLVVRSAYSSRQAPLDYRLPSPRLGVRYSWKTDNDEEWRYGLQFSGFHAFSKDVTIGESTVVAVTPEEFPEWVATKPWAAVTFIESMSGYTSSEGIYFYSADYADWLWLAGQAETGMGYIEAPLLQESSELTQYSSYTLPAGFRGEYTMGRTDPPRLYLSPVDKLLHLVGAHGGVWYLGSGSFLRYSELDGDGVIDSWSRERASKELDETGLQRAIPGLLEEVLFETRSHLLHADQGNLTIVEANHKRVEFTSTPPTDKSTWESFRKQGREYETQRRDPMNLLSWLDGFPGPRSNIRGAALANYRNTGNGFRFGLSLQPGYQVVGPDVLGLSGLQPGEYLVRFVNGDFLIEPLEPPELSISLSLPHGPTESTGSVMPLRVTIENVGPTDARGLTLIVDSVIGGMTNSANTSSVDVLSDIPSRLTFSWPRPTDSSQGDIRARLIDPHGQILVETSENFQAQSRGLSQVGNVLALSTADRHRRAWPLALVLFAVVPLLALRERRSTSSNGVRQ